MIDDFLTPWRIRTYAYAALFALGLAFCAVTFGSRELTSDTDVPLGGDFVVFYAAGGLVADGEAALLYDERRVAEAQAAAVGQESLPATLAYVYPPCVALGFAPLSRLPYRGALALYALLLVVALALGLGVLGSTFPLLAEERGPALACALAFYPLARSVAGGQNTALTLLLLAGALALLLRAPSRRAEVGAGLLLGLLCFKPTLGIPFLCLVLLLRRPWVLLGGGFGLSILYTSSAAVSGWGWPAAWLGRVAEWRGPEAIRNGQHLISLPGVGEQAFGSAGAMIGLGLAGAVVLGLIVLFWRRGREDLAGCWAVATAAVLLLSPHTQFYDAGLLALPAWLIAARQGTQAKAWLLALFLLAWTHPLTPYLPLQPLFLLTLFVVWVSVRHVRSEAEPDPAPAEGPPPDRT